VKSAPFEIAYRPTAVRELLDAGAFVAAWIYSEVSRNLTHGALTVAGRQRHPLDEPIPTVLRQRIDEVCPGATAWEQRVGDWRVIYAVDGSAAYVVGIGLKGRKTLADTFG
jgi:mRNA-degrading endonuclease RelE of RelBE toxin-antitoxin system